MKLSSVLVLLAASSGALAKSCTRGLIYCGTSLLKKGNYDADIRNTLLAFSKPVDGHHMGDSLFLCAAEDSLSWIATCRPQDCQDNGTNENDTCIGNSEEGDPSSGTSPLR